MILDDFIENTQPLLMKLPISRQKMASNLTGMCLVNQKSLHIHVSLINLTSYPPFQHTGSDETTTTGTHTTPVALYVDDLTYVFNNRIGGGCVIEANSISESLSGLDYGTNYCNLFNLMEGCGLTEDEGFTEQSDASICTQYNTANCDRY